jgi:GH25 family lysozyme M1 (1,4-beta-N-acetylmuramidase)
MGDVGLPPPVRHLGLLVVEEGPSTQRGLGVGNRFLCTMVVGSLVALSMAGATASSAEAQPSRPRPFVPERIVDGIDVSHWQGTINWTQVAGSGVRFAIMKATEGQTFNDPNYGTYRANANAAGVYIGAYHFARPDSTTNDATIEADHFSGVAAPRSGDIVPVLDLEDSGGLSSSSLKTWVQTWLDRVTANVGANPMIYTSPSFWRTYMGDTTQFADEGYRLLWIANWFVPEPDVPANNWGGDSWTFWQYDNCGSVPGVSGCVDLDYLKKSRQKWVRIH